MLLELENTSTHNINLLMDFAKKNNLKLQLVDEGGNDYYLPGKPLSDEELVKLIDKSRKSGSILMEDAHDIIRKSFHGH